MSSRVDVLLQCGTARYLFALVAVAAALALRILVLPLTGTGAPFALFIAAVLVTSLYAGTGPGLCALLLGLPLAAYLFVVRAGHPVSQATFQALLYSIDGFIVLYLTSLGNKRRRILDDAKERLRKVSEDAAQSAKRARDVIELAPDAYFLADLSARFTDVNQAACRLLGFEPDELIGKSILDIIPPALNRNPFRHPWHGFAKA